MYPQRTLAEKVICTGLGLHTGAPVELTLHPARVNSGIRFARRHAGRIAEVSARPQSVSSTSHATTLGVGDASVSTVEHLLAALYSQGVSNARIELDGPEVPVMDGSASNFIQLIRGAGIYTQLESQGVLEIDRRIEVRDGDRTISIEPAPHLRISYMVDFDHPSIGIQTLEIDQLQPATFEVEVARARTFGFLSEVEALRRAGLARGGSLANTVVLDASSVLNPEGLRWKDEFVRHKVMDLIGDISLLGIPIHGHIRVRKGGHQMHHRLVNQILQERDAWSLRGSDLAASHRLHLRRSAVPVLAG